MANQYKKLTFSEFIQKGFRIFEYFRPYWKLGLLLFLIANFYTVLSLINPLIVKFLIDDVLLMRNMEMLNLLMISFIGITIFTTLLGIFTSYMYKKLEMRILYNVRNELFQHLEELDVEFFHEKKVGDMLVRLIDDVGGVQLFMSTIFNDLIINILTVIFILAISLALNWQMTVIAIIVIPFVILVQKYYGGIIRKKFTTLRIQSSDFMSFLQERLGMMTLIKIFTREKYELSREKGKARGLIKSNLRLNLLQNTASAITGILVFSALLFILWYGGYNVITGAMSVGTLVALYSYIMIMFGPVSSLTEINVALQTSLVSINRVFEFLDKKPVIQEKPGATELKNVSGEIEFENVSFSYEPSKPVLERLNFKINRNENVAIVGHTGCGKTTIAYLIIRLYDPVKGKITIDGKDMRDLKIESLRKQIGIVKQEITLFHASIGENIGYGKLRANNRDIIRAAKLAGIHDFIMSLPKGYKTDIGEEGMTLSGGQRQEISLARTILKDPNILIFDEATSFLDPSSEDEFQLNMKKFAKNKTTIVIAHKLSTVKNADRILVLDNGKIAEQGTFNQLIKKKGKFYKLYKSQIK